MDELRRQFAEPSNAFFKRSELEKAIAESQIYWRQQLRKYIKVLVKNKPLAAKRIVSVTRNIKKLEDFTKEPDFAKEVEQALAILVMQKEIALNDDGEYVIPGTTPVKPRFRSLDAEWDT